jgi:hypothetical protein
LALAETGTTCPLSYQFVPDGVTLPVPEGLTEVARLYCVINDAVYVALDDGTVIEWLCPPPSLHDECAYRTPEAPLCGELTDTVCEDPTSQLNTFGEVYAVPSTTTCNPAGLVATVHVCTGTFTVNATDRLVFPLPFVTLLNVTVSLYDPALRLSAPPLIDTSTVVLAPAPRLPLPDDKLTHPCVFVTLQLIDVPPVFWSV